VYVELIVHVSRNKHEFSSNTFLILYNPFIVGKIFMMRTHFHNIQTLEKKRIYPFFTSITFLKEGCSIHVFAFSQNKVAHNKKSISMNLAIEYIITI